MAAEEHLFELVDRVYDAALAPDRWPDFLHLLADRMGATAPGLFVVEVPSQRPEMVFNLGIEPCWNRAYADHYHRIDLRREAFQSLPAGAVARGSELIHDHDLVKSEFYNDFLRPQGFFHIALAQVLVRDSRRGAVRVLRENGAPAFGEDELDLLRRITPHIERALAVQDSLDRSAAAQLALTRSIDQLEMGALVVERSHRIALANEAADQLLSEGSLLRSAGGRLGASRGEDDRRLRGALDAALTGEGAQALRLESPPGEPPTAVLIVPLSGSSRLVDGPSLCERDETALVLVHEPRGATLLPADVLQQLYGLSAREAQVTALLVDGCTVPEAAEALSIGMETAKHHKQRALQ